MPGNIIRFLTIGLAAVVLAAFAWIFGEGIYQAWECDPKPSTSSVNLAAETQAQIDDPYTYVATAIGVLVGGVVAIAFGRPVPGLRLLPIDPRKWLIAAYAIIYVVIGIAAVITWVKATSCTPVLVRNLATTFLGLLLPVVTNYFQSAGSNSDNRAKME
jgi:hypothetical protein